MGLHPHPVPGSHFPSSQKKVTETFTEKLALVLSVLLVLNRLTLSTSSGLRRGTSLANIWALDKWSVEG